MSGIIPNFYNVTTSKVIDAGWKNICIIPTGSVTLTNSLNPNQTMTITTPLMIGLDNSQGPDGWEQLTVTGTAIVIVNGAAKLE